MSDNTAERPVTTDQELARETDRRLDAQEAPTEIRAGDWVLSTEASSGALVAHHASGSGVKLADKPPEGADPDVLTEPPPPEQIPEHKTPRLKVKGGAFLVANAGAAKTYNAWNNGAGTADLEEPSGAWTWTGSTFTIPEDGDYTVKLFMPWTSVAEGQRSLELRQNGTIVDLDTKDVSATPRQQYTRIVQDFRCVQGDTFNVGVYQDSGVNVACGSANFGDAWAQLSIVKIADADIAAHEKGTL